MPESRQSPLRGVEHGSADVVEQFRALRALIDHVPAMVAYWDRDLRNVAANAAYVKWFGWAPDQVRGRHIRDLLGEDLYLQNLPYMTGALSGQVQRFDRTLVDTAGQTRFTQADYVPDVAADGTVRGFIAHVTDVTEVKSALQELDSAVSFRDAVLSTIPDLISTFDLDAWQTTWASRSLFDLLGYEIGELQELQAQGMETLLDAASLASFDTLMQEVQTKADGEFVEGLSRIRHADGSWRVLSRRSTPFRRTEDGRVIVVLNATRDVTAETERAADLARAHAFQQAVIATVPDLVFVSSAESGRPVWASRSLSDLIGWSEDETEKLGPRPLESVAHWDDLGQLRRAQQDIGSAGDGQLVHVRFRIRTAQNRWRWLQLAMTPFERAADGAIASVLTVARDVTDLVEAEEHLAHAALHDPLTGLPNRRLIADRLEVAVAGLSRGGGVGVLALDLDGFKRINDAHGHAAGDAVLRVTADRLCRAVRPGDTVGRMGGDEFVAIVASLPMQDAYAVTTDLAERIRRDVAEPVEWDGREHRVTASIGLVIADAGSNAESLLRDADSAMYLAKSRGKDALALYEPTLRADAIERAATEEAIRRALSTSSIEVFFQPIVRLSDQAVESVEALLRIRGTNGRYLDTERVVEVAEATGLISDIGQAVLRLAAQEAVRVPDGPRVSVNLSAHEIARSDLYERIRAGIDSVGLPPQRLALEVTETVLLEATNSTLRDLEHLRDDGVSITIDDFGTGYASLRYLTALPVTGIKIDRSFTTGLGHDNVEDRIVSACLWLTRQLDIDCVVEGVETREQLERLSSQSHVSAQGFLLGRPAPADEVMGGLPRPRRS